VFGSTHTFGHVVHVVMNTHTTTKFTHISLGENVTINLHRLCWWRWTY